MEETPRKKYKDKEKKSPTKKKQVSSLWFGAQGIFIMSFIFRLINYQTATDIAKILPKQIFTMIVF
ncbi:hypothetical protein DPMN_122435 [Dreissena polymorpha]|uniref:Uncharacterized protein n=1 Tax=Dreissena polymorpha TaxID=45954 RepID=A0A9D4JUH1_DREPO|nr:hypothetical protein DPMN_122435 [Dreissena polymorpha]